MPRSSSVNGRAPSALGSRAFRTERLASSLILQLALAACGPPEQPRVASDASPNVLILVADDLGVDAVGAYGVGSKPPPTPNIDALAARGVLFRHAWANPVCSPTRACLMTGRYSLRTRVGMAYGFPACPPLSLDETILPEVLDAAESGYAHAMIGKWHLGDRDKEGWRGPGLAGWAHYVTGTDGVNYYNWQRAVDGKVKVCRTYAPHGPWVRPPANLHTQDLSAIDESVSRSPKYFKAMTEALDREIGRLLRELEPQLARTNIIFIGDNGTPGPVMEPPFDPKHGKGTPYEGGVGVPLIVAGPAVASPGREEQALVHAVDVFASALELAGVDAARVLPPELPIDAVSFVPYLTDPGHAPLRSTLFAELFTNEDWPDINQNGFATIRNARYKVVRRYWEPRHEELYDLETDPWERNDLLGPPPEPDHPRQAAQLTREQRLNYGALAAEIDALRDPRVLSAKLPAAR
jgi:arylsulfatase A-like enzyme